MQVGDPITWVHTGALNVDEPGPRLFFTQVADVSLPWFRVDGSPGLFTVQDEGTTWINGRHARDSETGKALLAAYALDRCVA